jgi:Tfp pilus assembly protein PilN
MRAVNLLPAEHRGARTSSSFSLGRHGLTVVAVLLLVASVGGVALEARSTSSKVSARQQTLSQLDAKIAKLPKPKVASSSDSARAAKLNVVKTVAATRTTWDGFLGAFSRVIPEDVWLLSLSANAATPAAPDATAAPTAFTATGYTYSQPSVARLLRRLRLVPWLGDVSLTTSSKTALNEHTVYQFTVAANVIPLPEVGS